MSTSIRSEATRSVVVINGVDRMALNDDGSMELLTPAANPSGNKIPTAGQLPFTKEYVSPEQTITVGAVISLTHLLGVMPKLVQATIVCKTAELGFSVGDEVDAYKDASTSNFNFNIGRNQTTLRCICGANGIAGFSAAGVFTALTPANWRLIVRAWA